MAIRIQEQHLHSNAARVGDTHTQGANLSLAVVIGRDHGLLKLVRTLLEELQLEPHRDEPSEDIVETIGRLQPAVVIVDVDFGHEAPMWELLRGLKDNPATRAIPLIACAAAPWLLQTERPMLERNAVRTWTEPYDPVELGRMIAQAVTERTLAGSGPISLQ